jgi:hypothetical protein
MVQETFWQPGSIVKLKEPNKPSLSQHMRKFFDGYLAYRDWRGFTHGIIVQAYGYEWQHGKCVLAHVSLHLYDPERCLILCEGPHGIPTYLDYSVDELIPYKDGQVVGYGRIASE